MAAPKILDISKAGEAPVIPALGKDPSTLQQARNVMMGGDWAGRRRKGFRIARTISTSGSSEFMCYAGEHVFAGVGGSTYRFYTAGVNLYYDDGTTLTSASTLGANYEPVYFISWQDQLILWTQSGRKSARLTSGTITIDDLHISAPAAAAAAAAGAGTALPPGTYTYYICAENSNRGVQSGPSTAFTVTLAAANNVALTLIPAIAGQITGHKIYRTEANGVVAKYVATTNATSYTDSTPPSGLSSTDILPRDVYGTPFTSTAPNAISTTNGGYVAVEYKGMLMAAGSRLGTPVGYPKRIYFTQPGYPDRWSENYYIDIPAKGNITAMCVQGGNLIVATPYDIWTVFGTGQFGSGPAPLSDFVVRNVSHFHGIASPVNLIGLPNFAAAWSTCGPIAIFPASSDAGGAVQALRVPDMDRYIVPAENFPQSCVGFNPRRREIWFATPIRGETNTNENRRVLVYPLDALDKVSVYDLRVSSFMQQPGNNSFGSTNIPGYDLYFTDWMGNLCQAEYSDGDGLLGNEAYVIAGDTIATLGGSGNKTVTPTGPISMPTAGNGLRGVRVVGIPASATQDPEVRTIVSNTSSAFVLDEAWTNVAAGDKYYLGGILDDRITGKIYLTAEEGRLARAVVSKTQFFLSDIVNEEV